MEARPDMVECFTSISGRESGTSTSLGLSKHTIVYQSSPKVMHSDFTIPDLLP